MFPDEEGGGRGGYEGVVEEEVDLARGGEGFHGAGGGEFDGEVFETGVVLVLFCYGRGWRFGCV